MALAVAVAAGEAGLEPEDIALLDRATDARGTPTGRRLVLAAWLAPRTGRRPARRDVDALASLADDACSSAQSRDPRLAALALSAWHDTQWDAGSRTARATTARGHGRRGPGGGGGRPRPHRLPPRPLAALEGGDAVGADVELARYLRLADERSGGPARLVGGARPERAAPCSTDGSTTPTSASTAPGPTSPRGVRSCAGSTTR